MKVAVTVVAAVIVTVQVGLVPVQPPVQPVKTKPSLGDAVRVTDELSAWLLTQVLGQLMAPPETWPLPATLTESCAVSVESIHVALTLLSPDISVVHELLVPEHAPPQPLKTAPGSGVSTTVSTEPSGTLQEQVEPALPQSIWLLPPVTVPLPVNVAESVRPFVGRARERRGDQVVVPVGDVAGGPRPSASQSPSMPSVRSQSFQWSNVQPFAVSVCGECRRTAEVESACLLAVSALDPLGARRPAPCRPR